MFKLNTLRKLSYLIVLGLFLVASISTHALTQISDDQFSVIPQDMDMWISDSIVSEKLELPSFIRDAPWESFEHTVSNDVSLEGAIWLKFQVKAQEHLTEPRLLVLRLALINHARLFAENIKTGEQWASRPIGLYYPFKSRYVKSRHLAFPVNLQIGETYNIYIEVAARNLVLAPLILIKEKDFKSGNILDFIAIGLVLGAFLIMLVYNIGVTSILREKTYFFYCTFVLSSLMYVLYLIGIAPIYIWSENIYLHNYGVYIFAATTFLAAIVFVRYFLSFDDYGRVAMALFYCVVASWLVIIFFIIFYPGKHMIGIINIAGMITTFFGLFISVGVAMERNKMAIVYLVAWSFLMWGTLIFILMLRGTLEYNIFTAYSQIIGMIIELVLLSFALAYRINLDREQTAGAQEEALNLAKRVSTERRKRLEAQKETLYVQRNISSELERQVEKRTQQYEDAMDKLERANVDLKKLSLTDQLSQVYNRRAFDDAIIVECKRARREKQNLSVILVDIDHFKNINDTLGHRVGDVCIREVAATLSSAANRSSDMLARYGGEEFIFLLPNTSEPDALSLADKARKSLERLEIRAEGRTIMLTASFGVASWVPFDNEDDSNLVKAADKALYVAKEEGRNCVRIIKSNDDLLT